MHPLIVFICFLVFAVFVSLGNIVVSLFGLALLSGIWLSLRCLPTPRAWKMLRRMKIFFISIGLLYIWFTPGQLILPALGSWSPSLEGILLGAERVLALVILVFAVDSFLNLISREKILTALYYFFAPLHFIGFNRERFMLRTLLTIEAATHSEPLNFSDTSKAPRQFTSYINRLSQHIAELIDVPEPKTESEVLTIEIQSPPVWYLWLLPLFLFTLFAGVQAW